MSSRQPPTGMMELNPRFTGEQLARIRAQTAVLPRPRLVVTDQIPPPGSIVPRGTVVQVVITDINSLTLDAIRTDVPDAFKGVKVSDVARVLEEHPELVQPEAPGTVANPAEVANKLNTVGTGVFSAQVKPAEAAKAINVLRDFRQVKGRTFRG